MQLASYLCTNLVGKRKIFHTSSSRKHARRTYRVEQENIIRYPRQDFAQVLHFVFCSEKLSFRYSLDTDHAE
jgi:hypothetical protein